MANPNTPTLLSPNGGETFFSGSVVPIAWNTPSSTDSRPTQIEIFYTDNYSTTREPDWQQLAVVSGATTFQWTTPPAIHSPNCRIALRTRNSRGERSQFCVSADNFLITHQKLAIPTVISPINGSRYDKYIEIVPNVPAGTYSQRSMYQMFYSSVSAGIISTLIAQNVLVGTKSVVWNIIDVPPANDYVIEIYVEDDDNNRSDSLLIENITISHEGFFLVDTTPPVASISVNNGAEFTQFRDVTVSIVSFDETTGVQAMQIIEGVTGTDPANKSLPEPASSNLPFTLSAKDGTKVVELLLQDFGANRNNNKIQRVFETILAQTAVKIVDLAIDDSSTAWVLTSGVNSNFLYGIIDYPQIVYTFTDTPTAVGIFNSTVYVATKNAFNKGKLYRYSGSLTVTAIYTFTDPDSVINCIISQGGLMYMGFENGNVYFYDGAVLVKIATMPNPIRSLMSDGNSLYLALENDDNVYIYNGSSFVQTGV